MEWFLKVVRDNYANFEGRARRKEYWMFSLLHILIIVILGIIGGLVSDSTGNGSGLILLGVYILATFIPALAVTVRRLHDIGKSGWFILIQMIPYVGGLIMLVFTIKNGDVGRNEYGADPKGSNVDEIDEIGRPELLN